MARLVVVNTKNYKAIAYLLAIPILTVGGITIISVFKQKSKSRANLPKNDNPKKLRKTTKKSNEDDVLCNLCGKKDFVSYGRLLTHIELEHKDDDSIQNSNFTENNEKKTKGSPKTISNIEDISETNSETTASNSTAL